MEYGEEKFDSLKNPTFLEKHTAVYLEGIMPVKRELGRYGIADYGGRQL